MRSTACDPESAIQQLGKILASSCFSSAKRSARLLEYLVKETVAGSAGQLKEYTLGVGALDRDEKFDPRTDPIVRAEVSRLRTRLAAYYSMEGKADALEISIPRGTYVPVFVHRLQNDSSASPLGNDKWWKVATAFCALTIIAIAIRASYTPRQAPRPLTRLEVELTTEALLGSEVGTDVQISPDGSQLAFIATNENAVPHLYTRRLNDQMARELDGTEDARGHFFSPDGKWLVFWAHGSIQKIPAAGGPPIHLCDAADLLGGSWGDGGTIVAVLDQTGKIWRIPAEGGKPVPIADFAPDSASWPQLLPGSSAVLLTSVHLTTGRPNVEVLSLKDGRRKTIAPGGTFGRYLPSGQLVYISAGTLYAVTFDPVRFETTSTPVAILDDVAYSPAFGYAQLTFSQSGTFVYRRAASQLSLEWLDAEGRTEPILPATARYIRPRLSPNGRRVAYSTAETTGLNTWIYDLAAKSTQHLDTGPYALPVWTPDGRFLVLTGTGMAAIAADGSGHVTPLITSKGIQTPWSFTPDGKRMAYIEFSSATKSMDIWTVPIEMFGGQLRAGSPQPFLNTHAMESYPAFSPDGHWLAYSSDESGSWEVYVRAFPEGAPKLQISAGGGRVPLWSHNGHDLFYATDHQRIMKSSYFIREHEFVATRPVEWTATRLADTGVIAGLDLAPDGRRLIVLLPALKPGQQQSPNHATILLNFFDDVRRRLGNR